MEKVLNNLEETEAFAKDLALRLKPGQTLAFYGDLGSGKTTLIKFLAFELGVKAIVTSPTFVIEKRYPTKQGFTLVHIDCYRLGNAGEAESFGLTDTLADKKCLVMIEWAQRIEKLLPENTLKIRLKYLSEDEREVNFDEND